MILYPIFHFLIIIGIIGNTEKLILKQIQNMKHIVIKSQKLCQMNNMHQMSKNTIIKDTKIYITILKQSAYTMYYQMV